MERKSLIMRPIKVNNNNKVNNNFNNNNNGNEQYYSWDSISDSTVTGEMLKWPPRSYTCSFCKREFRSAQALGGHMNVHRKERARQLRISPPRNHHFNINVQPSEDSWIGSRSPSSSPSKMFPPFAAALPLLVSPSVSSISLPSSGEIKKCVGNFKKDEIINLGLDLEIGLLGESKEHLDLELRLGYS